MGGLNHALQRLVERVAAASASGAALEIRGGGTKRFYGNPPRGELLDLTGLSGITSYEPTELVVTALAGTKLATLEQTLADRGQCLPFEPPRYGDDATDGTVGGMVAAGLAGPARLTAGPVRDFVLGATVLTGKGELLTFGGQVMKNVAGYDVSRVLAGSMGVLGVICEVSLKVMPTLPASATLAFECVQSEAIARLNRWAAQGVPITGSAWHEGRLYLRCAGAVAAIQGVQARLGGECIGPVDADRWWSDVRDQRHPYFRLSQSNLADGECLWRLALPATAPDSGLSGAPFLEWGGAQRWLRTHEPAADVRRAASAARGHAALFRAADKSPGAFAALSEQIFRVHRRLKDAFDPTGIFNPGRLYADF